MGCVNHIMYIFYYIMFLLQRVLENDNSAWNSMGHPCKEFLLRLKIVGLGLKIVGGFPVSLIHHKRQHNCLVRGVPI